MIINLFLRYFDEMMDENLILFLQTFIQTFIQLCVEEVYKRFEKKKEEKKEEKKEQEEKEYNPRMISLYSDIFEYFKEFMQEFQSIDGGVKSDEGKILLGIEDKDLDNGKLSVETLEKVMNDTSSPINFHLENYMKNGDFVDVINQGKIKLDAYGNIFKECVDDYIDNEGKNKEDNRDKLKKERGLFDEYLSDNLIELKKVYVDIIISLLYPGINEQDKKYVMYEVIDRLDFEKYIPTIHKFLDKIDNRVLVK